MKNIILHHSASSWGDAAVINEWHLARGWRKIGYHLVILNGIRHSDMEYNSIEDGKVEKGRELNEIGAHCKGHNDAIGICFIGVAGEFTDDQIISCFYELKKLKEKYGEVNIKQHSDYDPINKPNCAGLSEEQMEQFRII